MFGRSSFGVSQPNSFGFGSGASTSFGQPNQLFGGSNNSFGSGSSGFGSTSQTIFGNPAQSTAPLFGSSATPAFGQTNQSSGFGSSLFGSSQQPSGSGGIFGSSASTSFGQQNKPGGFGFPSSSSGGLFGQNTQNQQNAGSMFQGSPSSGLFGSSSSFGGGQAQTGTVNKFIPVTGTDSVQKAGLVQSINTKHYCITCMKEYENKSLEELRWEDYQANRKGQQQSSFGGPSQPFGIASTNSGLFGQTENKPVFGQSSSSFGQPSFGLSSQTTPSSNMFGKSSAGFGNTTTTNSFVFGGTPTTAIFGSSSTTKPFATPSNPTLFGQTQPQQCNFGMNIFGQQNQPTSSNIFGKTPQQQGFNMGQSAFQFGAQPQNSNVFQNQKSGNTGFNIFGQPNTTTGAFAQPQQSSLAPFNNFSKPNQSSFSQLSFMGMPNSSFNNTSKSLFPSNNNLFTNNRSGFQPPPSGFNLQPQQPQQQPVSNMQPGGDVQPTEARPIMQPGDPYGYNPHLGSLTPMKQQGSSYATNPRELQKFLDVSQPVAIVSPPSSRIKMYPPTVKKSHLFDEGVDSATSEINLTLKSSAKRLIIRKNSNTSANREPSNTSLVSLESNAESEAISEPNLATFMSKGPPLFIAPPRLRKTIPFDEFSSPNLTPNESTTTLITEKSDASVLETDTAETENPTETTAHITQSTLSSQTSITDIFIKDADLASGDMCRRIEKLNPPPAIDTCGITLNRSDYYTIPPLEKLIEHKLGDGHCLIRGFTIGRVGYGNVSFPDLIDVANLNLDELVHFRYRELTIYPDDTKKPPQGQGLNRRAQVTLDRVYPKAKVDKKIIVDAATLTAINFTDTLRELCDKHGTKFLDYRPETGSWVFMVEHFSKYKYSDSDSGDDDTEELDAQTRQKISTLAQQVRVTREAGVKQIQFLEKNQANKSPSHMERSIQELMIDDDDIMVEDAPMQVEAAIPVIEDDMTEIDESVTDEYQPIPSSSSLHQVRTRRELYKTTGHKFLLMKATLFEDDYVPVNIEKDNIETIGAKNKLFKDFSRYGVPPKATDEIEGRTSRTYILKNKPGTVPLSKSLYNSRNYMDMGLFKSRSFKVGWGKGMTLTTLSNGFVDVTDRTVRGRVHIFDVTRALVYDPLLESLPEHMRIVLETSDIELIDGIPFASVKPTKVAMKRHQALAERTFLTNPNKRTICYYKETWDLVHALWNDLSWDTNHREELSQWFRDVLAREVDEILQECYPSSVDLIYKEIFVHLTGCQLTEAAELAIRNCSPNLALLISQMNVNGDTKTILQYQMEQWNTTMALDFMPVAVQKIYMLLSGMLIYDYQSKQGTKRINVCEYLNWRQCLAIILWYMTSSADSIAAALYIYKEAYSKHTVCMKPFPEHLDENSDVLDLQYYLMLLHCDKSVSLEKILHPLTHNSYAGDYRLSWLLLQMLTALRVGVLNEDRRVALATSFSSQLESLGLPKWAVFPLLFIKDATIRKNQIMRTLHRNIDSNWSDLTEKDLVKQLLIPSEWIHEVMSYKTKLLKQHWQNYQHLSHSQMWNDAHKIAIEYIIPDLIINEKFDIIRNILVSLEKGQRYISNWRNQGGLLLAFFKVARECNRNEMARYEALNTHSALLDIITRLPFYPMETSKQIAAASELSKRCYIFATVLIRVIKPSYKGIAMVTSIELDKLTLPADYFFQALLNEMLRV